MIHLLRNFALTPAARLAVGLASLTVCLFLLLDFALDLMPDQVQAARKLRQAVAETVAVKVAATLPTNDQRAINQLLRESIEQHDDLVSVGIRTAAGALIATAGDHDQRWVAPADGRSTLTAVQLPIRRSATDVWGQIELSFRPVRPSGPMGVLHEPALQAMLGLSLIGGTLFYLYLRRALQYLDPTSAVPERVRAAFDTLTEGLLVLDTKGRVVLANHVFRKLVPENVGSLPGRRVGELKWLTASLGDDEEKFPWTRALREGVTVEDESFSVEAPGFSEPRRFVIKANPILDSGGAKRGCLVTFDDVTKLHEMNQMLRNTLDELKASRAQVEQKNEELQRLASRDPMTGCLNRRSFFDGLAKMQRQAASAGQMLVFIMCDVDHFKSFNDRFGHALGDQVLIAMGTLLARGMRDSDLLCRLGGEEFCIAAYGMSVAQAMERAEMLRTTIETEAGSTLDIVQDLKVTASFGVACMPAASVQAPHLLELADQALYHAKRAGRNRVVSWPFEKSEATTAAAVA